MTELTSREILDAIDGALERVSERFAKGISQVGDTSEDYFTYDASGNYHREPSLWAVASIELN